MARVLMPLANLFEEIEAITVIDLLRRADVDVVVAGIGGESIMGSHKIEVKADTTLETLLAEVNLKNLVSQFDAIILPGGPGAAKLQSDPRIAQLLQEFSSQERWVTAICAAPMVLAHQGLLANKTATGFFTPEAVAEAQAGIQPLNLEVGPIGEYRTDPVVIDGKVITSRGAGTAVEFALQLVAALVDIETAQIIADRIRSPWRPLPTQAINAS